MLRILTKIDYFWQTFNYLTFFKIIINSIGEYQQSKEFLTFV